MTGVTAPAGFLAAGVAAGLKTSGDRDVALVVNTGPDDVAAGVFTRNRVQAAPVQWSRQVLADGQLRAVVLNAGGANACTGSAGFADAHHTAEHVAARLELGADEVAVCSTGLIGQRLPLPSLLAGVDAAVAAVSLDGGTDAADAIRTTDTVAKQAAHRDPAGWTVGGMAKGAGMLAPSLATMLCVLTTDADVDPEILDTVLRRAVAGTFERIDADGCLSTNDTVLLLANAAAGVRPEAAAFAAAVTAVCAELATLLIADAEGATKFVVIEVTGAASETDAVTVGRAVARNNLLKCALFGSDPNWGRVLAAVGTTDAHFDPDAIDVSMNGVLVCAGGTGAGERAAVDLTPRDVHIGIDLHAGPATATVHTTDLSHAYVHENSAYST